MALTLDTTLGGEFSNSYVDVEYADDYWAQHYDQTKAAKWAALSDPQKTSVLIQACSIIEKARFTFDHSGLRDHGRYHYDRRTRIVVQLEEEEQPFKYNYYQRLQFPRTLDRKTTDGTLYIPEEMKNAQCEQAMYLLSFDESVLANRLQGVAQDDLRVGSIATSQKLESGSAFAPMAVELFSKFLKRSSARVERG